VRFLKAKRSRSATWRGVLACALLLVVVYLIFDILDLDGSGMTGWPVNPILIVAPQQAEAERVSRLPLPGAPVELIPPEASRLIAPDHGSVSPFPSILHIRQTRRLPRVYLHRELIRSSSPTADPA
jgi:hypothetical protein